MFEYWWEVTVLSYNDDPGSLAALLLATEILLDSVISDAKHIVYFMSPYLKDYFLATLIQHQESMKVPLNYFPMDIQEQYKLATKVTSTGFFFNVRIKKGMYVLKQTAIWLSITKLKN